MAALVLTCYLSTVATDICRVHVDMITICKYKCDNGSEHYYSVHSLNGKCQRSVKVKSHARGN